MFGSRRSKRNDKRSAFGKVWGAPGEEKALQMSATNGLLLAYHEERYDRICEEMPQLPNASQLDSHSPAELHSMVTPWPFHTWGLDLVGSVNPPSRGYIWILVATEYFTKWAEAMSLRKATREVVANFIKENIIVRFGVPHRIIRDNGTPFINSVVRKMLEFYQVKHHRSLPYYRQGNRQAEASNKVLIKIINKMSQEYTEGWATHLPDALWAYVKSPKSVIGFSPFSLVYGTEVVSLVEVMTPSLRVIQMQGKEKEGEAFMAERCEDLEGFDERRQETQEHSRRYKQKMTEAYDRMTKERVFAEGQLMLKMADYVR